MATTRIIPMHHNKGKSVRQCFKERTDYVMNPEKTRQRELVRTYACNPKNAGCGMGSDPSRLS